MAALTVADIPELLAQYDVRANRRPAASVKLTDTSERLWWACPAGVDHRWSTARGWDRFRRPRRDRLLSACPFCAGLRGAYSNSIAGVAPRLLRDWDWRLNRARGIHPWTTPTGSEATRVAWRCPRGPDHRWWATPRERSRGRGCPMCSGHRPSADKSIMLDPRVRLLLDRDANPGIDPWLVTRGSHQRLTWRCGVADDHVWTAPAADVAGGTGCPACRGLQPSTTNSVASVERLRVEYDTQRNALAPDRVVAGTNKTLHWRCSLDPDHRWAAQGNDRLNSHSGCPHCPSHPVSLDECVLAFELREFFPAVDPRGTTLRGASMTWRVDAYVADRNAIIEHDGSRWHRDQEDLDRRKTRDLSEAGFTVIRLREEPLTALHPNDVVVPAARSQLHTKVVAALDRLADLTGTIPRLSAYRDGGRLARREEAQQFRQEWRRRAQARRDRREAA